MIKKKLPWLLVFLVLVWPAMVGWAEGEQDGFPAVSDFVHRVYYQYSQGKFAAVYGQMHPQLTKHFSREAYVAFQENNARRYQMKIGSVLVHSISRRNTLPEELASYLSDLDAAIFQAAVEYEMEFVHLGRQQKRTVKKDVFVAGEETADGVKLYLLWDPAPLED